MNAQILQNLKNKLRTRYENIVKSNIYTIDSKIVIFWEILQSKEIFIPILQKLVEGILPKSKLIEAMISDIYNHEYYSGSEVKDEKEKLEIAYLMLKNISSKKQENKILIELILIYKCEMLNGISSIDRFIEDFVEPLYNFVIESLDNNAVSLGIFQRYKEKCE